MFEPAVSRPSPWPASPTLAALVRPRGADAAALAAILLLAALARLWALTSGLPHAINPDETEIVDRAVRIMRTGDWNPHVFDHPTLFIHLTTLAAVVRYLFGAVAGEWTSLDLLQVGRIYGVARLVTAALGIATVWLVYRLGEEVATRRVGLLAAAQLALVPLHVRESHVVLPDVPVTALTTLAVLLSVRAGKVSTAGAYLAAAMVAGLAAATEYDGLVAIVPVAATWLLHERRAPDRGRQALAVALGASAAFALAMPYALLDLPRVLDGVAGQLARFAQAPHEGATGLVYARQLSASAPHWLVIAVAGAVLVLWRARERARWMPVLLFTAAYLYALQTHPPAVARQALPIVPMVCLFAAAAGVELVRVSRRIPALHTPRANRAVFLAVSLLIVTPFVVGAIRWIAELRRPDTRTIAAQWLRASVPPGSRVAVEKGGPSYLSDAGLNVLIVNALTDRPPAWYHGRADYLIASAPESDRLRDYLSSGTTVFQIAPTAQRTGPPLRIVQIAK